MNKFLVIGILALLVSLGVYLLKNKDYDSTMRTVTIGGTIISVEIADVLGEQVRGLSGRDSLCPDCGMLFVYERPGIRNFWMRDMKFPLDMVFIRDGRVVEIIAGVPIPVPGEEIPKVQSAYESDMVLEVNVGFAAAHGLKAGDGVDLSK